jgi:hypothetical protein
VSPRAVAGLLLIASASGCTLRHLDLTAERSARVQASGVRAIVVTTGAGWLRIQGHPGYPEVRAVGTAHASSGSLLTSVELTVIRRGDTVFVASTVPRDTGSVAGPAALDLTLDLPGDIPLDVTNGSGETVIRDVGPLRLATVGTGGVEIDGVGGALDVVDGPGDLQASHVRGDVRIRDGDGEIYLSSIAGSVNIPVDGAGEIQVADVTGSVHVGAKSSGEVSARDVGGDLLVDATGSGSVEYHDVKGRVALPQGKRGDGRESAVTRAPGRS